MHSNEWLHLDNIVPQNPAALVIEFGETYGKISVRANSTPQERNYLCR